MLPQDIGFAIAIEICRGDFVPGWTRRLKAPTLSGWNLPDCMTQDKIQSPVSDVGGLNRAEQVQDSEDVQEHENVRCRENICNAHS